MKKTILLVFNAKFFLTIHLGMNVREAIGSTYNKRAHLVL